MSKKKVSRKLNAIKPPKPSASGYQVGYKNPPLASRWKKGQSGNPAGGQKHNQELKAIKNLTNAELIEVGNIVIKGNVEELKRIARDDAETALKRMLASVVVKIISKGDMTALDVLLNRLVGKVKDQMDISGLPVAPGAQVVICLPPNGRERDRISA